MVSPHSEKRVHAIPHTEHMNYESMINDNQMFRCSRTHTRTARHPAIKTLKYSFLLHI